MDCDSIGNVRLTSVVASKNGHTCGKDIRFPLLGFLLSPGTSGRPSDWSVTVNCGMSGAFTVTSNRIPSEGSPIKMNPQGAVRLLQSVRVCLVALGLRRPVSFPFGPRRSRGLPVLVHVVSQRARVLRLRRTVCSLAISRCSRGAFLQSGGSRRPDFAFFEAQSPRPPIPLSTLQAASRDVSCKTQGQDGVAVSFLVGLFHSLQHAGLTRRSLINALTEN